MENYLRQKQIKINNNHEKILFATISSLYLIRSYGPEGKSYQRSVLLTRAPLIRQKKLLIRPLQMKNPKTGPIPILQKENYARQFLNPKIRNSAHSMLILLLKHMQHMKKQLSSIQKAEQRKKS